MRPPCLAAGGCLTPEARGATSTRTYGSPAIHPYPWNAGINPCDGQTKRRIPALPPAHAGINPASCLH